MKKTLFIFLFILSFQSQAQRMTHQDFWQKDKITHSIGTFGISTVTYTYLSFHKKHKKLPEFQKRLISLSTAMLVGGIKEIMDSTSSKHHASWGDMGANAVGAIAFQATIAIPLNFKRKRNTTVASASEH